MTERQLLEEKARRMRIETVQLCHRSGVNKAHLGGCMSVIEILTVLYNGVLRLEKSDWARRDRVILSKGHGALAQYAALHQAGILSNTEMKAGIRGEGTYLYRHTKRAVEKGIEFSTGSLGMGLGLANGLAQAFRRQGRANRIYVIIGDGECNEGSVWESAAYAGYARLEAITVIVDKNGLQLDGPTQQVLDMESLSQKWAAFGFDSCEVDGHDVEQLQQVLLRPADGRPKAVIARTIKGKGISFAENKVEWHDNYLSDDLLVAALRDLGAENDENNT